MIFKELKSTNVLSETAFCLQIIYKYTEMEMLLADKQ